MLSQLHSFLPYPPVLASRTFTYRTIVPPSPSHDSSSERVTPKVNPTPRNKPPNPVLNIPADLDSDTSSSYYFLSYLSDSSDRNYSKWRQRTKNNNNEHWSKYFQQPYKKVRKSYRQATHSLIQIKGHKVPIGQVSTTAPCYFHHLSKITW